MKYLLITLSALSIYVASFVHGTSYEYEKFKAEKQKNIYSDPRLPYANEADNRADQGTYVWYRIATADSVIPGVNF
jgi:hypothetical protein